jgi:cytolysin-activating lysine-acyltransferase
MTRTSDSMMAGRSVVRATERGDAGAAQADAILKAAAGKLRKAPKAKAAGARATSGPIPIDKASTWQPKDSGIIPPEQAAGAPRPLDAADKTVSTVLGEIVWLLSQSPEHKQLAIADLEWMVMPALLLRQFKLFYDTERNIPVGVVLFARVSPAVAARLDAGGRLATLDDWRSGETVRVMATVAPFGGEVKL